MNREARRILPKLKAQVKALLSGSTEDTPHS
jgi:hypothetical protein